MRRPAPASIQVVYDRLTLRLTGWRKQALARTGQSKADPGRVLLPPAASKPLQLEDLSVDGLTVALGLRHEDIRVLGLAGVTENRNYYYNAILLVYKDIDSNTLRLGVDIDGDWSELHATVLDSIGAVDRLGLATAPPETPYVPIPNSEATGTRMSRDEVIAIQRASTEKTDADSAELDRAQIRWLGVYEHPQWLDDALTNSKRRLLIISPWITRSVVNIRFVRRLESLARTADVTIFWGFGDNETTDTNALADLHEASRRSERLAIVKVDDTHAKVIVSDAYYIKTSFNWLSFRGDRSRKYRQEEGDLVQDQQLADRQYDRYMTQNCGRALEVIGTLPEKYRHLVHVGSPSSGATPSASQPTAATPVRPAATGAVPPAQGDRPVRRGERRPMRLPRSRDEIRKDALRKITAGQTMSGVIKNVTKFGAFVNLGDDVTGLIHISQLSTHRVGHPTEVVNVEDSVMVTVLKVDVDAERVSLKLKTDSPLRHS